MTDTKLNIAFWDYDRALALKDGSVMIKGVDATYHSAPVVTEIFGRMIRNREFDVSELGMSYFLRTMEVDDPPFLAIPVFLLHCFRHSSIFINKASGIKRPEDLNGKRIGELALYGHDAGIMPKGALSDDYGFKPESCSWIIGTLDFPIQPADFVPHPVPPGVDVTWDIRKDLGAMLERGEIDALISADVPKCVREGSPKVGRLFEDWEGTERDYYRRTGIYPIMHLVAVRKELADRQPDVVKAVYQGFCDAKNAVAERYKKGMTFNNIQTMVPWFSQLLKENIELLGQDWWPYGVKANRKAIDAFLRYSYEQGLSKRQLACEEIFVPGLLET